MFLLAFTLTAVPAMLLMKRKRLLLKKPKPINGCHTQSRQVVNIDRQGQV
jgi:hypothetical protein